MYQRLANQPFQQTYVGDVFPLVLRDLETAAAGLESRSEDLNLATLLARTPERIKHIRSLAQHSGAAGNVLFAVDRTTEDLNALKASFEEFHQ